MLEWIKSKVKICLFVFFHICHICEAKKHSVRRNHVRLILDGIDLLFNLEKKAEADGMNHFTSGRFQISSDFIWYLCHVLNVTGRNDIHLV